MRGIGIIRYCRYSTDARMRTHCYYLYTLVDEPLTTPSRSSDHPAPRRTLLHLITCRVCKTKMPPELHALAVGEGSDSCRRCIWCESDSPRAQGHLAICKEACYCKVSVSGERVSVGRDRRSCNHHPRRGKQLIQIHPICSKLEYWNGPEGNLLLHGGSGRRIAFGHLAWFARHTLEPSENQPTNSTCCVVSRRQAGSLDS